MNRLLNQAAGAIVEGLQLAAFWTPTAWIAASRYFAKDVQGLTEVSVGRSFGLTTCAITDHRVA